MTSLFDDGKEGSICEAIYNAEAKGTANWALRLGDIGQKLEARASTLRSRVRELRNQGNLALVVGAGLGLSCNLPSWSALVNEVFTSILTDDELSASEASSLLEAVKFRHDLLALAQAITAVSSEDVLANAVATRLYRDPSVRSEMLVALGRLLASMHASDNRGKATVVITFNYDTLIEEELERIGVPVVSLGREATVASLVSNSVNVWHIHGILRRPEKATVDPITGGGDKIVLTEASYGLAYLRSRSDPLQSLLTNGSVLLFVGFSFNDSYVRQILLKERITRGLPVAVGMLADESLIDAAKPRSKSYRALRKELKAKDASANELKGLSRRFDLRTATFEKLPSWFVYWVLDSVGVEWYRVPSLGAIASELDALAKCDLSPT